MLVLATKNQSYRPLVTGDQRPLLTKCWSWPPETNPTDCWSLVTKDHSKQNFGHWSPESNLIKLLVIKKLQQVVMMPILFDSLQYDILTIQLQSNLPMWSSVLKGYLFLIPS
jgi:hypothetical protein